MLYKCPKCGEYIRHNAKHVAIRLTGSRSEVVEVTWHAECLGLDEAHTAYADASRLPPGTVSDDACWAAYSGIRDAIIGRWGVRALEAMINVRHDVNSLVWTLRGHGAAWGVVSQRPMRVFRRPVRRRR